MVEPSKNMLLSGMEEFMFKDHIKFVNVGERCNISGSLKFKKLIKKTNTKQLLLLPRTRWRTELKFLTSTWMMA